MKIASLIARNLLGLMFLIFGLNSFLGFIKLPMPTGVAGQFSGALFVSHFFWILGALYVVSAAMLLANRYVVLAITILGPILVNIVLYHALMDPSGMPMAVLPTALWLILVAEYRVYFAQLFVPKAVGYSTSIPANSDPLFV